MSSSAASSTSNTVPVPSCDSWGHFNIPTAGANAVLLDGSGISGTTRISTGLHGVSFSNPERYGGGAYITIATTEMAVDAGYGVINVPVINGHTGAGNSAGTRFTTYTFPNGFHLNGGTAALADSSGDYRLNMVSFALATEMDLRSPAVLNVLKWSESFSNSPWSSSSIPAVVLSTDGTKAPNGSTPSVMNEGTAVGVQKIIQQYTGNYPVSVVNKPFTGSVYVKAGTRFRGRIIVYDASTIFFGVTFNLQTKALSSSTTTATATLVSSSITDVGGGWFRIVVSGFFSSPSNQNQTGVYINIGDDSGGLSYTGENKFFYLWGAQLEEGSVATPYIKTESTGFVVGDQDARRSLVPGARAFGVTGATYSSAPANLLSKRTATAYGTIVIPPNKSSSGSSTVSAYIENGFNVKGVSAGANSLFDVSFVKPMNNINYCTILCGEYESNQQDLTFGTNEATLLHIRAGTGNKYKTVNGFRVEALKQRLIDNFWAQQAVVFQSGLTERIHFMVFGGATYGQP
jgi:hypothetical protein